MLLRVTHRTQYDYLPAVENAQHLAYLSPRQTANQHVVSHQLLIDPQPSHQSSACDVFGNTRQFFALQSAHLRLTVTALSEVVTRNGQTAESTLAWEAVRETFSYSSAKQFSSAAEFVFASPYVPHHADFADYARPSFRTGIPLIEASRDLMQRIHHDFVYESQSTEVNTPVRDALHARRGVCQDFAHILVACLRAMEVPARYVSGYLLTHPAPGKPRLVGSDASHAWASVFLPDLAAGNTESGWYDLDPTNNRDGWGTPGEDYVVLAVGRDFGDVSPLRGVIHGGASHILTVGVTVDPVGEKSEGESEAPISYQTQQSQQ